MAYTANENIAIATAGHPTGPFVQSDKAALEAPVKQIDPFIFMDDDGKKYLYHVRLTEGNRIFVAEMEDDLSAIKTETLQECIAAEKGWENTQNVDWPVAEGPAVFKKHGRYYLLYSANDFRNPDYAVGYATSDNPYGPWQKYDGNPILSRKDIDQPGPGHGDFFLEEGEALAYVFHTHNSSNAVSPRRTAIINFQPGNAEEHKLVMDFDSFYFLLLKDDN
jgi:beta-xylosidase